MASCYAGNADAENTGTTNVDSRCRYLPLTRLISYNGHELQIELSCFRGDAEYQQGFELMNMVIAEGKSWPYLECFSTMAQYRAYFHSHASFAVRFSDQITYGTEILGCFYVKPNFPGRCSHVCNGGFITHPKYRGLGIGTFMGEAFKKIAKDLGYRCSLFNLVFANNTSSVALWKKLGFVELAVIPGAAVLNGTDGYVDAIQMFYDFTA